MFSCSNEVVEFVKQVSFFMQTVVIQIPSPSHIEVEFAKFGSLVNSDKFVTIEEKDIIEMYGKTNTVKYVLIPLLIVINNIISLYIIKEYD
jgi:hypothetical protein